MKAITTKFLPCTNLHLVYELASVLYGREGYACLGPGKCPSNYHVNHRESSRP